MPIVLVLLMLAEVAVGQVTIEIAVSKNTIELGEPLPVTLVYKNHGASSVFVSAGDSLRCGTVELFVYHSGYESSGQGSASGWGTESCGAIELRPGETSSGQQAIVFVDFTKKNREGELLFPEQGSYTLFARSFYEAPRGTRVPLEATPVFVSVDLPYSIEQKGLWDLLQSDRRLARIAGGGPLFESAGPEEVTTSLLPKLLNFTSHLSESSSLRQRLASALHLSDNLRKVRMHQEAEAKAK